MAISIYNSTPDSVILRLIARVRLQSHEEKTSAITASRDHMCQGMLVKIDCIVLQL